MHRVLQKFTSSFQFSNTFLSFLYSPVRKSASLCLLIILTTLLFCSRSPKDPPGMLARIGDRVITVKEFLYRAEFTPRPFYCRSNTEKDKIIALNSLIAEKLFALEEGEDSELLARPSFQAYLKGRKEQCMREELYKRIAVQPVKLDSSEIMETLQLAGLVYNLEYYTIKDNAAAQKVEEKLSLYPDAAAEIFDSIDLGVPTPHRTVKYKDPEAPIIHHALYSKKLAPGTVVGPLKLQENDYLFFKVKNVSYSPTLSETETIDRMRFVKERLLERKSITRWNQFVAKVMQGKDIQFFPQTTIKLAELYAEKKASGAEQGKINGNEHDEKTPSLTLDDLADNDVLLEAPFFKVDGKVWTVKEFRELLLSHPLIFRKPGFRADEYLSQFKLAVADLIRDHYLNKEAYKRSIDKTEVVKRNVEMWQDSYLAIFHREKYLRALAKSDRFDPDRMKGSYTYIDEYADSLQAKYSHLIKINYEAFKKIELTKTDLFAIRQFSPYPLPVPGFPQLCVDDKLDYGSR